MSYTLRSGLGCLLVLSMCALTRAEEGVAVGYVMDVSGQVAIAVGGNRDRAEIFDRIEFGHTLQVPPGGKVVFLYRPERVEYTFSGPATLQFSPAGIQVKAGNAGQVRAMPQGAPLRFEPNSRTRPEVRINNTSGMTPELGETMLNNRPLLSWIPGTGKPIYELSITDCGIDLGNCTGMPMKVALRTSAWRPSADDALAWGHIYRWSVSQNKKDRSDAQGWFMVVAPEQLEVLSALHPGESREVSQFVLYAQALEEVGARTEAREIWRQLAASRPDQRGLMCKAAGRPVEQCRRISSSQ